MVLAHKRTLLHMSPARTHTQWSESGGGDGREEDQEVMECSDNETVKVTTSAKAQKSQGFWVGAATSGPCWRGGLGLFPFIVF